MIGAFTAAQSQAPAAVASPAGADQQLATVKQYCAGCHNDRAKTAGVSFDGLTAASVSQHADMLEKAVRKMRGRVMPPPGARQPDAAAVDSLVAWLEASLDRTAGKAHIRDRVVLHRLNRKEYSNAVRDLLAVDFDATEVLPADDVAEGFDNIADVLQVSPSFIEQYVIAARVAAVKAMGRPDARPGGWTFRAGPGTQLTHVPGLPLGTRGGVLGSADLPADGEYIVDVADMATHIWGNGMEFENPLVVTLDNRIVYEAVIGGEEDMKLYDQVQNGALDRVNARLKNIRFSATAGPHRIGVTFRRQTFAESDDQLQMFTPGGGQDRLYRVSSFQLRGPFNAKGLSETPSRARIFTCKPADGASSDAQAACARQIITALATRAYRRPVAAEDVNELFAYYQDGRLRSEGASASQGFEDGVRTAITGMLASPFFLYRSERVPAGLRPGETYAISDLELASKLSFFLWNTIPDQELLQLGIDGKLKDPMVLERQVRRMLADARAGTLAANFVHQWLDMKRLEEIVPGLDGVPLRLRSIRSARGLPHRADVVRRQCLEGRPQRRRSAAGEPHLPQRAGRAALRDHRRERRSFPARRAEGLGAVGSARQGRGADGRRLSEPDVSGAARRLRPQAHPGCAAGDAAAGRSDAGREGHRHDEGAHRPRNDREAPGEPDVRVLSRRHGSARSGARKLRCDRDVAGPGSLCRRGHRCLRRPARRHADRRP